MVVRSDGLRGIFVPETACYNLPFLGLKFRVLGDVRWWASCTCFLDRAIRLPLLAHEMWNRWSRLLFHHEHKNNAYSHSCLRTFSSTAIKAPSLLPFLSIPVNLVSHVPPIFIASKSTFDFPCNPSSALHLFYTSILKFSSLEGVLLARMQQPHLQEKASMLRSWKLPSFLGQNYACLAAVARANGSTDITLVKAWFLLFATIFALLGQKTSWSSMVSFAK